MREFLVIVVFALGALTFAASAAAAKSGIGGNVSLTKEQVATVCGDKSYCEKSMRPER